VFLGSSTEGLRIARVIQVLLDQACEVTIWNQGIFGPSQVTLEALVNALDRFDFAVLVLTSDDLAMSHEISAPIPRDNVLFELGLFMGGLGRNRTFIVYDRTANLKLPSDLAGVSALTFEPHSSGNLESALGAAATRIEDQVVRLGFRERERFQQLSHAAQGFDVAATQMHKLINLIARSRRVELDIIAGQFGLLIPHDKLTQISRDLTELDEALCSSDTTENAQANIEPTTNPIPASPKLRQYDLADLLKGITPTAMREAFDWGPDRGRETS